MEDRNKNLTQEELNIIEETERFMEEVYQNPEVANAEPPAGAFDELMEKIRKQEEEKELIRLGRIYKKKRKLRKYLILAAAMVLALALGITSVGGGERIVEIFRSNKLGREQTQVNTKGEVEPLENITEEEVYQKIEDEYGFYPVTMGYRPKGVNFVEVRFNDVTDEIVIKYSGEGGKLIFNRIYPNYRKHSYGAVVEEEVIQEYEIDIEGVPVLIKKHKALDYNLEQWTTEFVYGDTRYYCTLSGLEKSEIEKIAKNLDF